MKRFLAIIALVAGGYALWMAWRDHSPKRAAPAPQAVASPVVPGGVEGAPSGTGALQTPPGLRGTLIGSSPLMRKLGLRVYPAEGATAESASAGVPNDVVRLPAELVRPGQSVFLLGTDSQLHDLVLAAGGTFTLPWGCGEELPGAGYKMTDARKAEGRLVLIGAAESKALVRWSQASSHEVAKYPDNLHYKPGYAVNSVFYSSAPALPRDIRVYTASWRSPAYSATPPDDPHSCVDWTHEQLGIVYADDRVAPLFDNVLNCDGQGYGDGAVGNLAGVLEIAVGEEKETWLIFEASGYEGAAYLSIRVDLGNVVPQKEPDFVVYSGC